MIKKTIFVHVAFEIEASDEEYFERAVAACFKAIPTGFREFSGNGKFKVSQSSEIKPSLVEETK